jgi:hypothetical protein
VTFVRERLPEPAAFFEGEGLPLAGRGKWRTTRCDFHVGSDSMRVNTESGGWVCMSCGVKGGDIVAYAMQRHGLEFVEAARALGAWSDDGRPPPRPRAFTARDALTCVEVELNVCMLVIADARAGLMPNESDWSRFLAAAGRIDRIAQEARQ